MAIAKFKLMSDKEFLSAIDLLVVTGKELNRQIQVLAVQAIAYSIKPNVHDARKAISLVDSFPVGTKKQNLVNFLEAKGMLKWDKESKKMVFHRRECVEYSDEYLAGLVEIEWHKFGPQDNISSVYDAEDDVRRLINKIQKKIKNAEGGKNLVLGEYLEEMYLNFRKQEVPSEDDTSPADLANDAQDESDVASSLKDAA